MLDPALTVPAGSLVFVRVPGLLGTAIAVGQALIGDGSRWTHVGVVLGDGTLVEAMPSGARVTPLPRYLADDQPLLFAWRPDLTDDVRAAIVANARALERRRYSFLSYLGLALVSRRLRPAWLTRYLTRSDRRICSALADAAYTIAGVPLFDDGRMPHDVTPGDLVELVLCDPQWKHLRIGRRDT